MTPPPVPPYSVKQVADALQVSVTSVRNWSGKFSDHLSDGANPGSGEEREYTHEDLHVLYTVAELGRQRKTHDDIGTALDGGTLFEFTPQDTGQDDDDQPDAEPQGANQSQLAPADQFELLQKLVDAQLKPYQDQIDDLKTQRDWLQQQLEAERAARQEAERAARQRRWRWPWQKD